MKEYATEQRKSLLCFLRDHQDETFSIEEIAAKLCLKENISISAIYRNIGKLVADGLVQRTSRDGSRKFYYQYIGAPECSKHLHMMCRGCGQVLHMDHSVMDIIMDSVKEKADFAIDIKKTILYGQCKRCH